MAIDYTPAIVEYKKTGSFRFWCQKVLPLVYDDSLSYYELLCKVVNYLNDVIANVDGLKVDIDNIVEAYKLLQKYVNDYFDNLDVQDEINNKLDELVSDGTMDKIINKKLLDEINKKIEDFVGTHGEIMGQRGWNVKFSNKLVTQNIQKIVDKSRVEKYYFNGQHISYYVPPTKYPLDMPVKNGVVVGSCDGFDGYPSNMRVINNSVVTFTNLIYDKDIINHPANILTNIIIEGERATPPRNPKNQPYENRKEIIEIAETYINATNNGRKWAYGNNFFLFLVLSFDILNWRLP